MAERITRAEYARRRGWSRAYVTKLVKQGKIRIGDDGLLGPDEADRMLKASSDPARAQFRKGVQSPASKETDNGNGTGGGDHEDLPDPGALLSDPVALKAYNEARTLKEQYQAKIKQLEYEQMIGKLVDIHEVEKMVFEKNRLVRNMIMNIPDRISAVLASELGIERDQYSVVHDVLRKELQNILEELSSAGITRKN